MKIDITVTRPDPINPHEFHTALIDGVTRIMFLALRRALLNTSGRFVKVQTGRLRSSLHTKVLDRGEVIEGVIGTDVRYAPALEFGSRPHLIFPRQKKALRWAETTVRGAKLVQTRRGLVKAGGRLVRTGARFAAVVHHPGTKGAPFLRTAVTDTLPEIEAILRDAVTTITGNPQDPEAER